ncbi:arrestin domain-containing protein 2-like isoform X1 [Mizuhopecten yessoensis]|uniref:Arrestin domain-containing protein 3 n=1 Tax=Mizuhopecten yessoensis TaxID=6573 RepID=A0A210QZE7_MIZYE|nr:arrestin domain-containing protein 2-like isoform X1 [Mizuhopecten yessoensis]OWF54133.1 Arrestin domain-containing protein 3 [Mizuhopecten yessoensis]
MAKLKSFNVTFTNTNGVCFAGRELGGAIVLDVASKYKMKELRLRFRGYALVHWTERHSNGQGKSKRTVTKHYSGEELYFDHTVVLFASSGNQYETIAEGQHKFPFEFQVPSSCPTSYEGTCGRVRYEAVATIERMFGVGHSTISGFTVISHIDLNEDPRVRESTTAENEMSLCCLCCKSGPIAASLFLDSVGFVPGQGIPIRAEVSNGSRRKIAHMTASLQMIVKYNAVKKVRTHCNIIASITKNDFASAGSKLVTWSGDKLVVPVVPPSFVSGCHIIDISYVLELIVNPAGPSFNLPVKMEVIVGTKPLRISNIPHSQIPDPIGIEEEKYLEKNRAPPSQKRRSLDHPNAGKSMDELCTKDNEPASTFEECILGAADLVDDEEYEEIPGPVTFTPMYPHYSFTGTQSPFDSGLKKQ